MCHVCVFDRDHITAIFITRAGMSVTDIVALMGAHSLGMVSSDAQNSGFRYRVFVCACLAAPAFTACRLPLLLAFVLLVPAGT